MGGTVKGVKMPCKIPYVLCDPCAWNSSMDWHNEAACMCTMPHHDTFSLCPSTEQFQFLTVGILLCSPSTALYRGPSDVQACRKAAAQLAELRPRMLDVMAGWAAESRAARTELGLEYRMHYERWKEHQDGEFPR